MAFPNLYYKRTVATAKACYICYKPTVTVLATIDATDFLYACPIHLADRGFATRVPDPESERKKTPISSEEIAKVKQEWEEKQRQKKDKAQPKEGSADKDASEAKGTDAGANADGKQEKKLADTVPTSSTSPSGESVSRPTHERYVLHRDIFALRVSDHRRRRQAAQTKDLAPRLPGAPRGSLS